MATLENRVIAVLSRAADVPKETFVRGVPLASLGIGSLERIECVLALEDELQVELDEADLQKVRTLDDLVAAAERAVSRSGR